LIVEWTIFFKSPILAKKKWGLLSLRQKRKSLNPIRSYFIPTVIYCRTKKGGGTEPSPGLYRATCFTLYKGTCLERTPILKKVLSGNFEKNP